MCLNTLGAGATFDACLADAASEACDSASMTRETLAMGLARGRLKMSEAAMDRLLGEDDALAWARLLHFFCVLK